MYLGSTIHSSGRFGCEVARKIGAATADFHALDKVWKHSCISRARKLELYASLIESKLRYALSSAWLLKADLRRLDGFQARCLRKILGVQHSFTSRVSNASVLQQSGRRALSELVKDGQIGLMQRVLVSPQKQVLREVAFHKGTLIPETAYYVRRVGRPRQNWTEQVLDFARADRSWREIAARIM